MLKRNKGQKSDSEEKSRDILIKELELCFTDANHLEDSIWAATGILITATVAGLGLLGSSAPNSLYALSVRIGIAILSICIIVVWYKIISRWYSLQRVFHFRCEQIEEELSMYKDRYIHYLDDTVKKNVPPPDSQFSKLKQTLGTEHRGRTVRYSMKSIRLLLLTSWIIFLVLQIVSFFHFVKPL